MGRKKRQKYNLGKFFYYFFYFFGSLFIFLVKQIFLLLRGSHEEIIYRAKDYKIYILKRQKKIREFKIEVNFLRKLTLITKIKILLSFLLMLLIFGFLVWYFIFRGLPSPDALINRKINVTTRIYDRNGVLLYQIYKDQNRTLVSFDKIPTSMKLATLASEDANFYSEHGFSLKGIIRAVIADLTNKDFLVGGSTITQQLVKNTLLTPEKTITRKIKELFLAIQVDSQFSKDQILGMYLNEVPYGGTAWGVEAASEQYFGKSVDKLDLAESALLAGLPKSPTTYSPFGEHPELAISRQKEVLQLMRDDGFITKAQQEQALQEKLSFKNNDTNIKAPHFVMYIRQKLVDEYGEEEVESGGLNVITTLDINIQDMVQKIVSEQIDKLKGFHVTNGAAIVLDPSSGEILAMVGSKDYFNMKDDGNVNVTLALRPPGSSIKVVNYAYALSHGFTPATILQDSPVTFKFPGSPAYSPVNYDNKFVGAITLRNAFAQSRNVPAVKVLATYGVDNMIKMGKEMGITTWNEKNTYGLSLTLGGGATKLIDLARTYATIAGFGERPPIISLKKVSDYKGDNLPFDCDTSGCEKSQVLDPRVAYQIINILSDNNARAPEFGLNSSLLVSGHPEVAVKTGTSNDLRDNLTIGFNQKYLTAVWVGNNDNSPMARIASGITGAAPIWNAIESELLAGGKSEEWKTPDGLAKVAICTITGILNCDGCPAKDEWFLEGTQPKSACKSDQISKVVNH